MTNGFLWFGVLAGLVSFGLFYNALTARLKVMDEGYTASLVVGGVSVTIAGAALLIGVESALVVIVCFVASGLPMIAGSWQRSLAKRKGDERGSMEVAKEWLDDKTESGWLYLDPRDVSGKESSLPGAGVTFAGARNGSRPADQGDADCSDGPGVD